MLDEIINNQRPCSNRSRSGYEPNINVNDSIPITHINEAGTRIFEYVLKIHAKEKENKKNYQQYAFVNEGELHCLEDLSLLGIKLYFGGIVIFVIIFVIRMKTAKRWKIS